MKDRFLKIKKIQHKRIKDTMSIKISYALQKSLKKKFLWYLFMDGVQLYQGYRATTRRQFTWQD